MPDKNTTETISFKYLKTRFNLCFLGLLGVVSGSILYLGISLEAWLELAVILALCLGGGAWIAAIIHRMVARLEARVEADRAAMAVRFEEMSGALQAQIEDRQTNGRKLANGEQRMRRVVEGLSHGVVVHRDGVPLYANPALADMLGYADADEVLALRSISDFVFEDDVVLVRNLWTRRMDGEAMPDVVGYRCQKTDGTVISVEVRASTIEWDGAQAVLAAVYDTTEQKSGEYAVRENAARLRRLVETIPHGVQENDIEGTITFSNPAHAAMLGYDQGELIGKKIWDFEHDDARREFLRDYFSVLVREQPEPQPYFGKSVTKDGRFIDVRVDWTYIKSPTGHLLGFTSIITDVTAAKKTQLALERSESHFRALAEASFQGITVIQNDRYVFANPAAARMLGYAGPDDFMAIYPLDQIIHPDDAEMVRQRRLARTRGEDAPTQYDLRLIARDGRTVWIHNRVTTIEWDGAPAIFSIYDDITEQKSSVNKLEFAD